jgi:hypothetical protein
MATEEDVAAGLLNWINSLEVAGPVSTVDDLIDGSVIWKVLRMATILHATGHIGTDNLQRG